VRRRETGYTLAELVIVIVIAAILAALTLPQWNQTAVNAAWYYEQARSTVRYAQRTAVAQRRCMFVRVTGTQLEVMQGTAACAITATPVTQLGNGQPVAFSAPSGVALSAAPNPFSFNGLGQPSSAATVTVGGRTIAVNAETGYVQ
jgi:MSHA pilin protein MshC